MMLTSVIFGSIFAVSHYYYSGSSFHALSGTTIFSYAELSLPKVFGLHFFKNLTFFHDF